MDDETTGFHLSPQLDAEVRATLDEWAAGDKVTRLWARDATLWTGADEASWLGWLGVAGDQLAAVGEVLVPDADPLGGQVLVGAFLREPHPQEPVPKPRSADEPCRAAACV